MSTLKLVLLVLAIVCFGIDGLKLSPKINGTVLGLAFYATSLMV